MDRKKQLKEQYKQTKQPMGIIIVRSLTDGRCYLEAAPNLQGVINRTVFQLKAGSHPFRSLQQAWREQGEEGFAVEILDTLEYDEDGGKTDYTADLNALRALWEEKLAGEGTAFFGK